MLLVILAGFVQLGAGAHFVKMSARNFLIKMDEKVGRKKLRALDIICAHASLAAAAMLGCALATPPRRTLINFHNINYVIIIELWSCATTKQMGIQQR